MQETQDAGQSLGWEGSPGVEGNLLQYSCLKNSMDRGAWWAIGHGVTKSQTWWSTVIFLTNLIWGNLVLCELYNKDYFSNRIIT